MRPEICPSPEKNWEIIGNELELIHTNYMVTNYLLYGKELYLNSDGHTLTLTMKKVVLSSIVFCLQVLLLNHSFLTIFQ